MTDRRPARRGARDRPGGLSAAVGTVSVVLVLLAVIVLVGALVVGTGVKRESTPRIPVPRDVPPAPGAVAPAIDVHAPGRTALQLRDWVEGQSELTGIPVEALMAYGNADVIARGSRPQCHLQWNTLAGLGYVETRHGTYDGVTFGAAELGDDGVVRPPIVGPALDGSAGFAEIRDTDGGRLDGDPEYDRAVGPLQFIPESWARYGIDASGDDVADPQNIEDAAASAVRLLCADGRDLATPEGWTDAVASYNRSGVYIGDVRDAAAHYAVGQPPS
ncbi:lytic transglycosylase domain-containing protein [Corynebacterium bovis]|uniref:lytic transglycosylase domain-containing protein n=1 Tax=Corynebacterium bovis TaxID=36808 RepID=UPI0031387209